MNRAVKTIRHGATVRAAAEIMNRFRIGSLIVLDAAGRVVGIITERDILQHVVAAGRSSDTVRVEQIMTRKLVTVDPHASLEDAADLMVAHGIKKLPVIERGELIGIITATDLIKYEKKLIERIAGLLAISPLKRIGG
jgi:CBS domain-containing protein